MNAVAFEFLLAGVGCLCVRVFSVLIGGLTLRLIGCGWVRCFV